jgi:autotransporter-associated beta strand protein
MTRIFPLAIALCAFACAFTVSAADKWWDINGAAAGAGGATPSGTWDAAIANWSASAAGDVATTAWTAGDRAIFSAGTDATGLFNVTVTGTHSAAGITVEEGIAHLIGSGAVAIGTGSIVVNSGATLSYDNQARITASAGSTVTLNGGTLRNTITGSAGTFFSQNAEIILGADGGTFSYTTANVLNIVQTGTKISGSGSLTKTGAGVLAFAMTAGNATYTGATIVNEGELRMRTVVNTLPTATDVIVNSPGIFNLNGVNTTIGSLSGAGRVGLANGTLTISGEGITTFTGTIEDTANAGASGATAVGGKLTRSGTGTLVLTGNNTYTGGTTKSGTSVLKIGHNNALGTGALTWSAGTISSDGSTARTLSIPVTLGGNVTLGNATDNGDMTFQTGAWTLTGNRTLTVPTITATIDSVIGEDATGGRKLTKAGNGTLVLTANNNFTGGFQINAGSVAVGHNSALGTGLLTLNGGTFRSDSAAARTIANNVTQSSNSTIGGSGALTFNGDWTLSGGNRTLTVNNSAATTIAGAVGEDVAGRNFTKAGTGSLEIGGAASYTGNTTVNAGTLKFTTSVPTSPTFTVASDATLDLSGQTLTLGAAQTLTGGGTVANATVAFGSGSSVAPGSSPGNLTIGSGLFDGGATYIWEINDVSAGPGLGWDLLTLTGALDINATAGNKFIIDVTSLKLDNTAGDVHNFNNEQSYAWTIASAGSLLNFNANAFDVQAANFSSSGPLGDFFLSASGNDIVLNYTAVPEPSSIALGLFGGADLCLFAIRRRRP